MNSRLTDPVVNPQPRNSPEDNDIPASKDLSSNDETSDHDSDTDIREKDQWQLVLLEEDTVLSEVEMGDLQSLSTSISLASQVEQEITRPAEQLMDDIVPKSRNWRILCQFCELNHVGAGLGSEVGLDP